MPVPTFADAMDLWVAGFAEGARAMNADYESDIGDAIKCRCQEKEEKS